MRTQGICTTVGRETRSTERQEAKKKYKTACIVTTENKHLGRVPRLCTRLPDKANPVCIPSGLLPPSHSTAHGSPRCHGSFDPSRPQQQGQESRASQASHGMGANREGRAISARASLGGQPRDEKRCGAPAARTGNRAAGAATPGLRLANWAGFVSSVMVWGPRVFRVTICIVGWAVRDMGRPQKMGWTVW